MFLRHGLWAIVAASVMWVMPDYRNLHFVLGAWLLGGLAALLLAVFFIRDIDRGGLQKPVDWKWIKVGFLVSIPFVISTLSLKAVYTADRYWVEHFNTVEVLASYVLFIGLANVIMSFLDASVISFIYPGMVSAAGKKDGKLFVQKFKEMAVQVTVVSLVLAVMVVGLSGYLIEWIGKNSYLNNFDILYWVVLATVIFALSMIPHYGLYAFKDDRSIVFSHILVMPIFFAALYLFQSSFGPLTVPVSMLIAFLFLFFVKSILFYRVFRSKRFDF
jgi:O-antigen/teichoic acid export membrane protein